MQIEGALTGRALDVTNRNMARTLSVALPPQHFVGIYDNRSWTVSDTQTAAGANDEIFYFLNTHTRISYIVTRLFISAASSETVTLAQVTGTAAGGTALAPVNRSLGEGRTPTATIQSGTDITGLTPGSTLETFTGTTVQHFDLTGRPLVIRPNTAIALSAAAGSIAVTFGLDFYAQVFDAPEV